MFRKLAIAIMVLFISGTAIFSQTNSSGESIYSLYSPELLWQGYNPLNTSSIQAVSVNPAAAAMVQRFTLDASYINLERWDSAGNYDGMGHFINGAVAFPSKFGVTTINLHFFSMEQLQGTAFDWGTGINANVAFSKELYPDILVGGAIDFTYGNGAWGNSDDWGLNLSLGTIFGAGDWGKAMKNVEFGIVLSHMGKGYGSVNGNFLQSVPEGFTPAVSFGFDFVDSEKVRFSSMSTLSAPTCTDLAFNTALELEIAQIITIGTSSSLSVANIIDGYYEPLIPTVGIGVNLNFGREETGSRNASEMDIQIGFAPLNDGVYAFGGGISMPFGVRDNNAPVIEMDYSTIATDEDEADELIWISPNFDGTQDTLDIPYKVKEERYIESYTITITNSAGEVVRVIENKESRPENVTFGGVFKKIFSAKESVEVPESFYWDGTMDNGELAPDGDYSFVMTFVDDNGNVGATQPAAFAIDVIAPEATVMKPQGIDLIFSPDGDGNKDVISFNQSGSEEVVWSGVVTDINGNVVRELKWENGSPEVSAWDGMDNSGEMVPDGVYNYTLSSTDLAGNSYSDQIANIIVNTAQPEVEITIDRRAFSPNNDGAADYIQLGVDLSSLSGLSEWSLEILDSSGNAKKIWTHNGGDTILREKGLMFDGIQQNGSLMSEGTYRAYFIAKFQNGYIAENESPEFILDITAPVATVSPSSTIFSPDGDGRKDVITFNQNVSEEDLWEAEIVDVQGNIVKSYSWRGDVPQRLEWNGFSEAGLGENGRNDYSYRIFATDLAGNRGESELVAFTADTSEVKIQIAPALEAFSPNRDGNKDIIPFNINVSEDNPVKSYRLNIITDEGYNVAEISSGAYVPAVINWDGISGNTIASDGLYKAELEVEFERGDILVQETALFELDTVAPTIEVNSDYLLFSPDGDGRRDILPLIQSSSNEELFSGVLVDITGNEILNLYWNETLENLDWDGRDNQGNLVDNGVYQWKVSSLDKAGNYTERTVSNINVDNRPTPLYITAVNMGIRPSISGPKSKQTLTLFAPLKDGVESWEVNITRNNGSVVAKFTGNGAPPASLDWDGRDSNGNVTEGIFTAEMVMFYEKGNNPTAETATFIVDDSTPVVDVDLEPAPFSPDNDNVEDELAISIDIDDLSPISSWLMEIEDPKGNDFITFSGTGRPADRFLWDGRSANGELVMAAEDYPYTLTVVDELGNTSVDNGIIPVDILVIRDGENLKIMISSITFMPYRAELVLDGEKGQKNQKVLERLAEILKKYSNYQIVIEGHAVSEYYYDADRAAREEREELAPLSSQRAAEVRNALIELGIDGSRIDTIGMGGTAPVVPHGDMENNWKNRRVEFILIK